MAEAADEKNGENAETGGGESSSEETVAAIAPVGMLGRKLGMTQVLDGEGRSIAVTVIEVGPCVVVQRKTPERDGYAAIQFGFDRSKQSRENKATIGHASAAGQGTFNPTL